MKKSIAACIIFLFVQAALAQPFNPDRFKTSISLVFLESEINDVLKEMTSKNILALTLGPNVFNWNRMIDDAIAYRASHGGCSAECYAASQMKIPFASDVYYPLYFKMKSAAFDFRSDGKIFLDATIGIFLQNELASFSIRLETTPQLSAGSTLQLTTTTQSNKPIGTAAFQSAKLSICLDEATTKASLTSFTLNYSNSVLRDQLTKMAKAQIEKAAANAAGTCHTLTEGLLPPRSTFAKGQRMDYPIIKVSDGLLELKTKLIVPKDVMPAINLLLLN